MVYGLCILFVCAIVSYITFYGSFKLTRLSSRESFLVGCVSLRTNKYRKGCIYRDWAKKKKKMLKMIFFTSIYIQYSRNE